MKKTISIILCLIFFIIQLNFYAVAASNPYGQWQTIGGITTIRCTYYAWQQAYDNLGVALPQWGNAINWYNNAKLDGYSTGTTPKAKSIAVWSTANGYGHVGYVVSVSGSKMTVNEAGLTNSSGTAALNGNGINNGGSYNNVVGEPKFSGSSTILVGFIYLTESVSPNITITPYSEKTEILDTNAILWGTVNKPSSYAVTKIGIAVRKNKSTYDNGWSRYDSPSSSYVGSSVMYPWYNLNEELGLTLEAGTKYFYKFYATVGGTEYWSNEYSFTTTGTHSHSYPSSWTTVTVPTCTSNGIAKRVCLSCDYTATKTLNALGHSYSIHEYEEAHPHKYYKKCNCGDSYYTGEYAKIASCKQCNPDIQVSYYNHTFNISAYNKALDDVLNNNGSMSAVIIEAEKGYISSETVDSIDKITPPQAPARLGYRFNEWKTVLSPKNDSENTYFIQAQYTPLQFSKGECKYGDLTFDEAVDIRDLVRIKKILSGLCEDHISADLDCNGITEGSDIISLRKYIIEPQTSINVYFDANGGNSNETVKSITVGDRLGELPTVSRENFVFKGWYSQDNVLLTAETVAGSSDIFVTAKWSPKSYTVNWTNGTGYSITVKRTASPYAMASIGSLSSGETIYYGDELTVSYTANTGYSISSNGSKSFTVVANLNSSQIYATATANSYTYDIVYKSSSGTQLGSSTAKYKFGTTNTITPKSFTGYTTPSSKKIQWDSTSRKTITFTYSPVSVSSSQSLASGAWAIDGSTNYITYSVKAEYRNRTDDSIQIRIIWTNTLKSYYYYQRGQVYNATIDGVGTGNVTIVSYNTWLNSATYDRSLSGTSSWITVPVSATKTSVTISADAYKSDSSGNLSNINESWSATFKIPTY